jgi:hypothetical protein
LAIRSIPKKQEFCSNRKKPTVLKKYPIGLYGKMVDNEWGRMHF